MSERTIYDAYCVWDSPLFPGWYRIGTNVKPIPSFGLFENGKEEVVTRCAELNAAFDKQHGPFATYADAVKKAEEVNGG
jgi:hypothetical protein